MTQNPFTRLALFFQLCLSFRLFGLLLRPALRLLLPLPGKLSFAFPLFLEPLKSSFYLFNHYAKDLLQRTTPTLGPFPLTFQPSCIHLNRELASSLRLPQVPGPTWFSFIHVRR